MMKLSEYIKRLQKIAESLPMDPDVAINRYSDLTTDLNDRPTNEEYPRVTYVLGRQEWSMRVHESMSDEQKATAVPVVELAHGN
jgi:hypothetical protein